MRSTGAVGVALLVLLGSSGCGTGTAEDDPPGTAVDAPPAAASSSVPAPTPAPAGAADAGASPAVAPPPASFWRPEAGTTWQYQLDGSLDLSVDADVYDVDWEDTTADRVQQLHAAGRRVVCYVNAGAYEDWRPDAGDYPADVLGDPLDGWDGERWLDVRRLDVLLPIIAARMDVCRAKGFDAVEADNVDGYSNASGFDLSSEDQIRFNTAVARLAHERGLSVGLKNDVEQVAVLEPSFDFAVNEECLAYDECQEYRPFLDAGKAVLHVEYTPPTPQWCAAIDSFGLSSIFKDLDLGADLQRC